MIRAMNRAALALVERGGCFLAVWNVRYGCWGLPGGKVEEGECPEEALTRELVEEVECFDVRREFLFQGTFHGRDFDTLVTVYRVELSNEPGQGEPDKPIAWLSR